LNSLFDRIKHARALTLSIVIVVAIGIAVTLVTIGRAQPAAPEEIVPTVEQQHPSRIACRTGAVESGLSENRLKARSGSDGFDERPGWQDRARLEGVVAQNDGKGGVKFVTMKIARSKRRKRSNHQVRRKLNHANNRAGLALTFAR